MKLRMIAIILAAVLLAATFTGHINAATGDNPAVESTTGANPSAESAGETAVKVFLVLSLTILLVSAVCIWGSRFDFNNEFSPNKWDIELLKIFAILFLFVGIHVFLAALFAPALVEQMHPAS